MSLIVSYLNLTHQLYRSFFLNKRKRKKDLTKKNIKQAWINPAHFRGSTPGAICLSDIIIGQQLRKKESCIT